MNRIGFLLLIACLWPLIMYGQGRFTAYTLRDGLSDNGVMRILQDNKGYIWVGTKNGLNRYDGYRFRTFRYSARDTFSISGNVINVIVEDYNQRLWIAAYSKGINCYDPVKGHFRKYLHSNSDTNSIGNNNVFSILHDSKGRIWVGTGSAGLDRFDERSGTFEHNRIMSATSEYHSRHLNTIRSLCEDGKGNLWVATNDGLYYFNTVTRSFVLENSLMNKWPGNGFHTITKIQQGSGGKLWLSTTGAGIIHYDPALRTSRQYLYTRNSGASSSNIVNDFIIEPTGTIWIATADSGLGYLDTSSGKYVFLKHNGQVLPSCNTLIADREGNIWVGSSDLYNGGGLFRYNQNYSLFKNTVTPDFAHPGFHNKVICFHKLRNRPWYLIGLGSGKGLMLADTTFTKFRPIPYPAADPGQGMTVIEIIEDNKGQVWLNSNFGLLIYEPSSGIIRKAKFTVGPDPYLDDGQFEADPKGNIWFANHGNLYFYNHDTIRFIRPQANDSSLLRDLIGMYIDPENNIWFVTIYHGLARYDIKTNQVVSYPAQPGNPHSLPNNEVIDITQDSNTQTYYVSVKGCGLSEMRLDKNGLPVFSDFPYNDRLVELVGNVEVDQGLVWMTSSRSFCMHDPANGSFIKLDEDNGLLPGFFGPRLYFKPDGTVMFGVNRTIQEFHIRDYLSRQKPAALVFSSFNINGEDLLASEDINYKHSLELKHNQNFFSFEVTALNFRDNDENNYSCKLEGFDKDWNNMGTRNYAGYTDVKPGKYTLLVRYSADGNNRAPNLLAMPIIIAPPFWQTAWFLLILAAVFVAVVYVIYRMRINTIKERERLKTDFNKKVAEVEMSALRAQMNPHFLFNCLNSINRYVLMSDQMTASEYLTQFAKLIRLILDNSKKDMVSLEDELEALRLYMEMESLRFEQKFEYRIEVDEDLNAGTVQLPPMLLQPFVENSIWHGLMNKDGTGHIVVKAREENDCLVLEVEDDGVGREKAAEYLAGQTLKRKSYGMQITSDRISILNKLNAQNAKVEITDMKDKTGKPVGTRVLLQLPMVNKSSFQHKNENVL